MPKTKFAAPPAPTKHIVPCNNFGIRRAPPPLLGSGPDQDRPPCHRPWLWRTAMLHTKGGGSPVMVLPVPPPPPCTMNCDSWRGVAPPPPYIPPNCRTLLGVTHWLAAAPVVGGPAPALCTTTAGSWVSPPTPAPCTTTAGSWVGRPAPPEGAEQMSCDAWEKCLRSLCTVQTLQRTCTSCMPATALLPACHSVSQLRNFE